MASAPSKVAIVVGASGGIGGAVVDQLSYRRDVEKVFAVSRKISEVADPKVTPVKSGSTEGDIQRAVSRIKESVRDYQALAFEVVVATGILHDGSLQPEKRIESLDNESALRVFEVNTLLPMLWLKALSSLFSKKTAVSVAVLSARVGSIGDNGLGGWYSYRASKSALNMMLKTYAVESARRFPLMKLISFHPGTTETALSEPFRSNVPDKKLFTPEFVAQCLATVMSEAEVDGMLSFVAWDGKAIDW